LRSTICGLHRHREEFPSLGLLTLSSTETRLDCFLPESHERNKRVVRSANRTLMLCRVDNLARRRIEQHAHIPYTHGCRRICDALLPPCRPASAMSPAMPPATSQAKQLMRRACAKAHPPPYAQSFA